MGVTARPAACDAGFIGNYYIRGPPVKTTQLDHVFGLVNMKNVYVMYAARNVSLTESVNMWAHICVCCVCMCVTETGKVCP